MINSQYNSWLIVTSYNYFIRYLIIIIQGLNPYHYVNYSYFSPVTHIKTCLICLVSQNYLQDEQYTEFTDFNQFFWACRKSIIGTNVYQ